MLDAHTKVLKQLFLCNSKDGYNSIFCTLMQCQVLVESQADLNLISSEIRRIPETSFVRAYIEPLIHPLISNEHDTLFCILSANI
jgi:hypothetical protein